HGQLWSGCENIYALIRHARGGELGLLYKKIAALIQNSAAADPRLSLKIEALRTELVAEIRRVDTRIDGVDVRIEGLDHQLRTAIDIRERLAALEARRPA